MTSEQEQCEPGAVAINESDTNADACCLGRNFIVQLHTNRAVDAYSHDTSAAPITDVPIVSGVTAWDCKETGATCILVFHESLCYGNKLDHTLINPNQTRHNGIDYWDNPYDKHHNLSIEIDKGPIIDLYLQGTKVIFESRVPTSNELATCEHIEMTSSLQWEPQEVQLGQVSAHETMSESIVSDSDQLLRSITPSLIMLKEMSTRHIQQASHIEATQEDIPARRSFISHD